MRKKIQLEGKAVSRNVNATPETLQSLPVDKLRPLLQTLADEVAEATRIQLDKGFLGLLIEAALGLHGLGHLVGRQGHPPEPPKETQKPEGKRRPPWELEADEFSSAAESDLELDLMDY